MLCAANSTWYTNTLKDMQNNFIKGNNNCPRYVTESYNMLNHYVGATHQRQQYVNNSEGVAFDQGSKGGGRHNIHSRK